MVTHYMLRTHDGKLAKNYRFVPALIQIKSRKKSFFFSGRATNKKKNFFSASLTKTFYLRVPVIRRLTMA